MFQSSTLGPSATMATRIPDQKVFGRLQDLGLHGMHCRRRHRWHHPRHLDRDWRHQHKLRRKLVFCSPSNSDLKRNEKHFFPHF